MSFLRDSAQFATGWINADESWAYASVDGATGVITIPAGGASKYSIGMRVKLTQTTVKYFLITAVADTTLTVWGGTDYTLANAAISANYYSLTKAPIGFPLDPAKWTVTATDTTARSQASPVKQTWYNLTGASIVIPIGAWYVSYKVWAYGYKSAQTGNVVFTTLSTANNTESDANWTTGGYSGVASGTNDVGSERVMRGIITIAAKATYYLNICWDRILSLNTDGTTINFKNDDSPMVIQAVSAYL